VRFENTVVWVKDSALGWMDGRSGESLSMFLRGADGLGFPRDFRRERDKGVTGIRAEIGLNLCGVLIWNGFWLRIRVCVLGKFGGVWLSG
jgi:hypothetical protein